ncbi:hypothetical protein A1O3_02998 [Capronia epimyces CBS 606.96]|uniref:Rho family, other n=1 Tax=Capronia epimyces CBS 606.96 TaxID=1182542 RepID=W9YL28_9EURO|nr:uncharacterized protein A1O3_02998 [Capronia epimyces CBS 606.96]EXJ89931.1 hypothetical protein A1O3_02998 [Capronia epimyces CBS 606.96]
MVVVGEPGALKTRLCYAMAENKVRDKASYIPTVFPPCDISFETDKKQYMATLLDTAGQEDYDRLRPLSYPQTDVFIMCFPLSTHPRNDMIIDNLRTKWVPEIRHFCPHAPFLLVGVLDTDDELWESYRVALGTKLGEGEKLAKELGALEYLECDPIVTMAGVQEVFKTVRFLSYHIVFLSEDVVGVRLLLLTSCGSGDCFCL